MCYQGLRQHFYSRPVVQTLYMFYTEFIFTASYIYKNLLGELRRNEDIKMTSFSQRKVVTLSRGHRNKNSVKKIKRTKIKSRYGLPLTGLQPYCSGSNMGSGNQCTQVVLRDHIYLRPSVL